MQGFFSSWIIPHFLIAAADSTAIVSFAGAAPKAVPLLDPIVFALLALLAIMIGAHAMQRASVQSPILSLD